MSAQYLYAIVADHAVGDVLAGLGKAGIGKTKVKTLAADGIAAVVSTYRGSSVRPQRTNIAAHQKVLSALLAVTTPLPISFGTIAENAQAVHTALRHSHADLKAALERVRGKVEMGLNVRWDLPNIFEYFVDRHPPLRALRDTLYAGDREPPRDRKIELGRLFSQLLEADRERYTAQVEAALQACCAEIRRTEPRKEAEIMRLSCLVERADQATFEAAVLKAAQAFDDHYAFDFNGPWAPHSFVDVPITL
ncbi:GvpL/GvpF family gas vesicle protein [Candidatus Thiosymbion oneisti]|uniref:GvpL/GvpF family gas vesicle protein n=1 Tax=Candidatus Thiosymbion oneisti TaxID=589554 RepID=UPI00105F74E7|nr:GvpL/GvpF family gas vesicle protein [Candidatus Thiosymbion oneisti]